jgi:hypothetical protein
VFSFEICLITFLDDSIKSSPKTKELLRYVFTNGASEALDGDEAISRWLWCHPVHDSAMFVEIDLTI